MTFFFQLSTFHARYFFDAGHFFVVFLQKLFEFLAKFLTEFFQLVINCDQRCDLFFSKCDPNAITFVLPMDHFFRGGSAWQDGSWLPKAPPPILLGASP